MDGIVLEEQDRGVFSYYVQDQYVTYRYQEVQTPSPYPSRGNFESAA